MRNFYIAGPMTGYPEHNFPAFNRVADQLRAMGHKVINPADLDGPEFDHDNPEPWSHYLRRDIHALLTCDSLYMLEGWDKSKGATLERHIAHELGMPIFARLSDVEEGIAHDDPSPR